MNQASYWKIHFALLFCITVGLWSLLFYLVPRGFDITDNAFYLMTVRNYDDYTAAPSMFHTIIKPLYDIGGASIINFRLWGAFISLLVSIISAFVTVKYFLNCQLEQATDSKWYVYSLGLVIIAGGTLQFNSWINTPNYNWLNHIGLMIFLSGLFIWLNKVNPQHSVYAPFLIMFGFGITFWAKPPTAILMPFIVLLILIVNRHAIKSLLSLNHVVFGVIGGLLGLSLVFLQGDSINGIVQKLQLGIALQSAKTTTTQNIISYLHSEAMKLPWMLRPILYYLFTNIFTVLIPIICVIGLIFYNRSRKKPQQYIVHSVRFLIFFGWMINAFNISYRFEAFQIASWNLNILFITMVFITLSIFSEKLANTDDDNNQQQLTKTSSAWSLLVFFIPIIFSFGTSSAFTQHTGLASYFYVLATIILWINPMTMKNKFIRYSAPVIFIILITYAIGVTANDPYRQRDTLYDMKEQVSIQFGEDSLIVSPSMAIYANELQEQATLAGFEAKTPIIDLTRNSPGSVFILDGRADVFPWILGNNEPPHNFVFLLLEEWTQEDREIAWVITTTGSTLESEMEILAHFGLDLSSDYQEMFTIARPYREESQTFWRPMTTADSSRKTVYKHLKS